MADSLSFGGALALPVAAIAACCESFQLSLLAMTFPLASRNESVGRRYSGAGKRWTKRTHEDTKQTYAVPPDDGTPNQHVVAGPNESARAQVRRLRVCTWINIVNFRQPDAGGHYLSLEEDSVSPGRKSNQNRSDEIIRRANPVARICACCVSFQLSLAAMSAPVWIEQVKGQTGQGSRNPKGSR